MMSGVHVNRDVHPDSACILVHAKTGDSVCGPWVHVNRDAHSSA